MTGGEEVVDRSPKSLLAVVPGALLVGIIVDILVRSDTDPSFGFFLFFLALGVAMSAAARIERRTPSTEAWIWVGVAVTFASVFVLRASPALHFFVFLASAVALTVPALRGGVSWTRGAGVSDFIESVVGSALYSAFGVIRLSVERFTPDPSEDPPRPERSSVAPAVLRGLLLAVPPLIIFGILFMDADPVFEGMVHNLVGVAFEELASHVIVTGVFTWLAAGYLVGSLRGTGVRDAVQHVARPSLGIVEVGVVLSAVSLLFAAFVLVQFRYLFGGAGLVEVTPGLTYAEYAREGFAQLAFASALVLPGLLAADWVLGSKTDRDRKIFRVLGGIQILLLLVVIASAFHRVLTYLDAYGLTESRLYGAAFLLWLVFLSFWFGVTVLRGHREHFATPSFISAYLLLAMLVAANPDGWIVRSNVARAAQIGSTEAQGQVGSGGPVEIDATYLGSLSADAVPALMVSLPQMPSQARCEVALHLVERWTGEREGDWRDWNRAVNKARRVVQREEAALRAISQAAEC